MEKKLYEYTNKGLLMNYKGSEVIIDYFSGKILYVDDELLDNRKQLVHRLEYQLGWDIKDIDEMVDYTTKLVHEAITEIDEKLSLHIYEDNNLDIRFDDIKINVGYRNDNILSFTTSKPMDSKTNLILMSLIDRIRMFTYKVDIEDLLLSKFNYYHFADYYDSIHVIDNKSSKEDIDNVRCLIPLIYHNALLEKEYSKTHPNMWQDNIYARFFYKKDIHNKYVNVNCCLTMNNSKDTEILFNEKIDITEDGDVYIFNTHSLINRQSVCKNTSGKINGVTIFEKYDGRIIPILETIFDEESLDNFTSIQFKYNKNIFNVVREEKVKRY